MQAKALLWLPAGWACSPEGHYLLNSPTYDFLPGPSSPHRTPSRRPLYMAPYCISCTYILMSIQKTSTGKRGGRRRESERSPGNLSDIPMVTYSESDRRGPRCGIFFPLEEHAYFLPWSALTHPGQTHYTAHACSSSGSGVVSSVPSHLTSGWNGYS